MKSSTVYLLLALIYGYLPSLTQVVEAGASATISDGETLAKDGLIKAAVATPETKDMSSSPILRVGEKGNEDFKSEIEEIHLTPSRPGVRKAENSGWKVLDGIKERYFQVTEAIKRFGKKINERFQVIANRLGNALKRGVTKSAAFQEAAENFIMQFDNAKNFDQKLVILKASLENLLQGAERRSRAEFQEWAVAYAAIMKLEEFQLEHLKLESELEHGLNDLQTRAYFSQNWMKRKSKLVEPLEELQRDLQSRREKFINNGYFDRVELEIEQAPWDLEILWPRGRVLDIPGEKLQQWFSFSDSISEKYQILASPDIRNDLQQFKDTMEKLKKMVSKSNKETTSKEKTAATVLLAYVYELTERQRGRSPEAFLFTQQLISDLAHQRHTMFRPNRRRLWIEIKGEPPKALPPGLDLRFLSQPTYNELSPEFRIRLDTFKKHFDQAVKDDSGMKVHNQVLVLGTSLEDLHHHPTQRNPLEFKVWAKVYAQIMKEFETDYGRSPHLQHLKLEAVMEYGLLNLRVLAKSLSPNGKDYFPPMLPLVTLQVRLSKRLKINGKNGWIRRFKHELGDTPWDMEILFPEDKLLDYLGKARLEEWLSRDPVIRQKLQFLSSKRSDKEYSAFETTIDNLEKMAKKYNPETSAEQKTAASALLAYASESIKDPDNGLPLTAQEAQLMEQRRPSYRVDPKRIRCFPANFHRLNEFSL
ncbi:hypothetical protein O181_045054 [Austropuccinia psidii MF-1]|uniref:Uncharacterized protein n=1 Tax=Austropuccinia psidii MF-1 TaxID=1389203 RepID=A0A9Q3DL85_9BASI|nr:hypothetical protein [Austropuccinia psidii MF-1]